MALQLATSGLERLANGIAIVTRNSVNAYRSLTSNRLENFLKHETENPYVARAVASIAANQNSNNGQGMNTEEAIQRVNDGGKKGVLEVIKHGRISASYGGGGPKCWALIGIEDVMVGEYGIDTISDSGVSGGFFPRLFNSLRLLKYNGIDTSPQGLRDFSIELRDSLGISYMQDPHRFSNAVRYGKAFIRSEFQESLVDKRHTEAMFTVLQKWFEDLTLGDIPRFTTQTTNYRTGERQVLSARAAPDEPLYLAIAKTIAYPGLLSPVRDKGELWTDGGYHGFLLEQSADLSILVILNGYVPRLRKNDFKGISGTVRQRMQDHSIMESRNIELAISQMTGQSPAQLALYGDPRGQVLLMMPNLRRRNFSDYFKSVDSLVDFGRSFARRSFSRFFDPDYRHPQYDYRLFLPAAIGNGNSNGHRR